MTAGNPGPVVPQRYVQALGGLDPIESMRRAPKRIKKLLKGVPQKRLAKRPAEGKWSIKEVLAHLADGEVVLGSRYRMVAAMDRPQIVGYDQDAFVERLCVDQACTEDLLKDFSAVRKANVRLLERLPPEALARIGLHTERGEESLADMLVMYAGHDRVHEQQIARALAEIAAASRKRTKRSGKRRAQRAEPAAKPRQERPEPAPPQVEVPAAEPEATPVG